MGLGFINGVELNLGPIIELTQTTKTYFLESLLYSKLKILYKFRPSISSQ